MKPALINGRDVSLDADFFIELGADRESIAVLSEKPGEHRFGFVIDGTRFLAKWYDDNNVLFISCPEIPLADADTADKALYALSRKMVKSTFGDLVARKIVTRPEGCSPELLVILYQN